MRKKKYLAGLLSVTLIAAAFAGCTNSHTPQSSSSQVTATSPASGASAQESASPAGGEGETITMMYNAVQSDAAYQLYNNFVESYNAQNEFGVTAEIQFYENEQYKTKLTTLMAANNVTDIFFTWELDYLRPFVEGGKVLDITDMLEADQELKDSLQEGVLPPLTYDGKLYGLPTQTCFTPMFYNTEIFEQNGLTPPTTWEEFIQICETLKANGVTPLVVQASDAWIPAQLVQHLVNGIGGLEIYNGLLDGSVAWNNPTHVEAGRMLQDMVNAGYMQPGFLGMKQEEGRKIFIDGNAAMHFMGTWEIGQFLDEGSPIYGKVSAFGLPGVKPENNNLPVGSLDSSLAISSQTKHPEAAFGMIKHWLSKENQEALLYEVGRIPSTKLEIDRGRVNPLMADCLVIQDDIKGMSPWLDRAFGAGEGVEFNNTVLAICGGEDPQTAFDNLQRYVEETVTR